MAEHIAFGQDDIFNAMQDMPDESLDSLGFGAIQLDSVGTIRQYNAAEGAITGRDPGEMVGQNFFRDVAPCTVNPNFYGRFAEGVEQGQLDTTFEHTFDHGMEAENVRVHMRKSEGEDTYWILVKRL